LVKRELLLNKKIDKNPMFLKKLQVKAHKKPLEQLPRQRIKALEENQI